MTFEKDFPSLKHLRLDKGLSDIEEVLVKDTLKHCFDKQRVREAIDKIFDLNDYEDKIHNNMIKKELGLQTKQ